MTRIPFMTKRTSAAFFLPSLYLLFCLSYRLFCTFTFFSSDVECFGIAIGLYVYYLNEYLTNVKYFISVNALDFAI